MRKQWSTVLLNQNFTKGELHLCRKDYPLGYVQTKQLRRASGGKLRSSGIFSNEKKKQKWGTFACEGFVQTKFDKREICLCVNQDHCIKKHRKQSYVGKTKNCPKDLKRSNIREYAHMDHLILIGRAYLVFGKKNEHMLQWETNKRTPSPQKMKLKSKPRRYHKTEEYLDRLISFVCGLSARCGLFQDETSVLFLTEPLPSLKIYLTYNEETILRDCMFFWDSSLVDTSA